MRRLRHGADFLGLARWLQKTGREEEALRLFRRAIDLGLPDSLLFRTLWDIAAMERRAGRPDAALAVINELAESRNPYRARALEALAKHYEHRERNYAMALEMTLQRPRDRGKPAMPPPRRTTAKESCKSPRARESWRCSAA